MVQILKVPTIQRTCISHYYLTVADFNIFSTLFLQLLVKKKHLNQKFIFNVPHTFKVKTTKYVIQQVTAWSRSTITEVQILTTLPSPGTLGKLLKHHEPSIYTMGIIIITFDGNVSNWDEILCEAFSTGSEPLHQWLVTYNTFKDRSQSLENML